MTKITLLILLTLNGLFLDAINAQSNHCSSMGTDTSFEYIKQVRINTLDNLSGNNEGYENFTHLNTELDLGQSYEITLTPGYKGSEFNESWNIWIDFNNDGDFDDDGETVLSHIAAGEVTSSINIPDDIKIRTVTTMRIAMKYNSASTPCEIFSFGEVEDYTVVIKVDEEPCSDIISDGFESSYDNWNDGGIDCSRVIENAITGSWSVRLRDDSGEASSLTTNDLALSTFEEVTIDFSYYPYSMEEDEDFWLQISTDGGVTYSTLRTWASGKDFVNETKYFETIMINKVTFSDKTRIRFRCDASANADQVYLDDIVINACSDDNQVNGLANIIKKEEIEIGAGPSSTLNYKPSSQTNSEANIAFTVYPNPAREKISISVNLEGSSTESYSIKLMDSYGNVVKHQTNITFINDYQLDISDLINGIYYAIFVNENGVIDSQKVLVSN